MLDYQYLICPIIAWFFNGSIKFIFNFYKYGAQKCFNLIGYGGFPSTHSSIISSTLFLILINEGPESPIFAVIFSVSLIIFIDAKSLRGHIANQAKLLNKYIIKKNNLIPLREKFGHSFLEITGGIFTGFIVALTISKLLV